MSSWSAIKLQNVSQNVDVGLIIQATGASEGHRASNLLERLGKRLSLPSELENSFCQARRFRVGAAKVAAMAACATGLVGALPIFRLFRRKVAAGCGSRN